jgi:acyl-CoA thioesterase-2
MTDRDISERDGVASTSDGGDTGPTQSLADLFSLIPTGEDKFVGRRLDEPWPSIYGGLMVGQACAAAALTVDQDRPLHSLHAYFVKRGDPAAPLSFSVERTHEAKRFSLRRVVAWQGADTVLDMSASFHRLEPGWRHSATMPVAPDPEDLDADRARVFMALQELPAALGSPKALMRAVDYRVASAPESLDEKLHRRAVWFKIKHALPDAPRLHEAVLAYMTDFSLIGPSLSPHRIQPEWTGITGCSLDHTLWVHDRFRCDEWLLYVQDSPWSGNARGLARGMIFDRQGQLVASTAQEGLIRPNS